MFQYITDRLDGLEEVLQGGCRWVQLRMKDAPRVDIITVGKQVGSLCRRYGARFIIDDHVELVNELDADGVHLGRNDMAVDEARKILGKDKIIGATANTREDIDMALSLGADYLGVGPFRFTNTKKNLSPVLGLEGYRCLMTPAVTVPVVAIGGITVDDLREVMSTGVTGVAVSSVVAGSPDKRAITQAIVSVVGA